MTTYNNVGSGGCLCGGFAPVSDPVVVITAINQVDIMKFRVQFRSQRVPPVTFRVYLAGQLIATNPSKSGTSEVRVTIPPGQWPFLEIIDDPNGVPHYAAPGAMTLNWRQISGAAQYEIQEKEGLSWVTLRTQPELGQGNGIFLTPWLADDATAQFQVVPLDATGAAGTPISFQAFIVRHPDVPTVTYTINSNRTITIAS